MKPALKENQFGTIIVSIVFIGSVKIVCSPDTEASFPVDYFDYYQKLRHQKSQHNSHVTLGWGEKIGLRHFYSELIFFFLWLRLFETMG